MSTDRKEHELFICDLCLANLKVFSHERKYYTRKDLVRHRKSGDPDEKSHRGHPICTFCDQRHVDDDELNLHLRREHFYCHFCDPSGLSHFYADYSALKDHFLSDHYLCRECDTQEEKFTNAFRSEIDLQAHIAQFHSQNMTKSELKKAKTLSLDLFIRQRSGHLDNGQQTKKQIRKEQRRHNNQKDNNTDDSDFDNEDSVLAANAVPTQPPRPEDFPSLVSNATTLSSSATTSEPTNDSKETKKANKKSNSYSIYLSKNPKLNTTNDDEFPALPGGSSVIQSSASTSMTYNKLTKQKATIASKQQTNVRKNVNLIDSSEITSQKTRNIQNKPLVINREEFPSLPVTKKKNSRTSGQNSSFVNTSDNKREKTIEWSASSQTLPKNSENKEKEKNKIESKKSSITLNNSEDFPSLEINKKKATNTYLGPKPVPRPISRPMNTNPPPGLSSLKKKTSNLSLSSVAQEVICTSNGDNSSESSNCLNSNDFCYINAIDFNERNQSLVRQVEDVLNDRSKFLLFKEASKQFRQSIITGEEYFQKCIDLFGRKKFLTIFSELLVLLPDIKKQNELLRAQQMELKNAKGAIPKGSKLLNDSNSNEFFICPKCRQVLINKDQSDHMSAH